MWWPIALARMLHGRAPGRLHRLRLGFCYGEKVMSLPLTRKFLSPAREVQIKGYFHRHGFKILILGRFAVGFRTAAYLTAGILKLPALKLFVTDLVAASLSTLTVFGLGFVFARPDREQLRPLEALVDGDPGSDPARSGCSIGGIEAASGPAFRSAPPYSSATTSPCHPTTLRSSPNRGLTPRPEFKPRSPRIGARGPGRGPGSHARALPRKCHPCTRKCASSPLTAINSPDPRSLESPPR